MSDILVKYFVILIHIFIIACSIIPILFSDNLVILGIMCFLVLVVFIQVVIYDGCILSKYERITKDKYEFVPSEVIKTLLCLGDSVEMADLQKLLVGGTLAAYLAKIGIILFVEVVFEMPVRKFLSVDPYLNNRLIQVKHYL
jgi:hypothetical protein